MMRRVGILGGMGPEATILVMQKVLQAVRAADDSDHVPLIVDQNTQVPSRIRHLVERTGADPAPVLADMARRLVFGGAEALAMPCNTAHYYAPAIRAAVAVPFLDMIELACDRRGIAGRSGRPHRHPCFTGCAYGLAEKPAKRRSSGYIVIAPDCAVVSAMMLRYRLMDS